MPRVEPLEQHPALDMVAVGWARAMGESPAAAVHMPARLRAMPRPLTAAACALPALPAARRAAPPAAFCRCCRIAAAATRGCGARARAHHAWHKRLWDGSLVLFTPLHGHQYPRTPSTYLINRNFRGAPERLLHCTYCLPQ